MFYTINIEKVKKVSVLISLISDAGPTILNYFLEDDEELGACSTFVVDGPGIALPKATDHL